MSNQDLIEWCNYLKIPINNFLSRDQKVPHKHKLGLLIYNLEPPYMEWMEAIGMLLMLTITPLIILLMLKRKKLTLFHQNNQKQDLYTTTRGYFCL